MQSDSLDIYVGVLCKIPKFDSYEIGFEANNSNGLRMVEKHDFDKSQKSPKIDLVNPHEMGISSGGISQSEQKVRNYRCIYKHT